MHNFFLFCSIFSHQGVSGSYCNCSYHVRNSDTVISTPYTSKSVNYFKIPDFPNLLLSTSSRMSTTHISKGLDYAQIILCAHMSDFRSNFFSKDGCKPYYMSRLGSLVTFIRVEQERFGIILLIVKENNHLSLYTGNYGWTNNDINFSLKLVQIEITSTLDGLSSSMISIISHRYNF